MARTEMFLELEAADVANSNESIHIEVYRRVHQGQGRVPTATVLFVHGQERPELLELASNSTTLHYNCDCGMNTHAQTLLRCRALCVSWQRSAAILQAMARPEHPGLLLCGKRVAACSFALIMGAPAAYLTKGPSRMLQAVRSPAAAATCSSAPCAHRSLHRCPRDLFHATRPR